MVGRLGRAIRTESSLAAKFWVLDNLGSGMVEVERGMCFAASRRVSCFCMHYLSFLAYSKKLGPLSFPRLSWCSSSIPH